MSKTLGEILISCPIKVLGVGWLARPVVTIAVCGGVAYGLRRDWRRIMSRVVDLCVRRFVVKLRSQFMRFDWSIRGDGGMPRNHTHPAAAHQRDELSRLMTKFCFENYFRRYDISMSRREVRAGVAGQRNYFGVADLGVGCCNDEVTEWDLVTFCDVDYYLSEDEFVEYVYGKPFLMNTFCPNALTGTVPDGRYWYVDNRTVLTVLLGGARYYHKTYNFENPYLVLERFCSFCVYNVDRCRISDTRYVVLCTPLSWVFDPTHLIRRCLGVSQWRLSAETATVNGQVMHKRFFCSRGYMRSIMTMGDTCSVELPEVTFSAIKAQFDAAKHNNISDVEKFLRLQNFSPVQAAISAPLLFRCLKQVQVKSTLSVGIAAPGFQVVVEGGLSTDNDGKQNNVSVSPPIVAVGGPSPVDSHTNDLACVAMRVVEPHNVVVPGVEYQRFAEEFVSFVVPSRLLHRGIPITADMVIELQDKPLQRLRSDLQRWWRTTGMTVKAFQKKETYAKVAAPRNISTVTPAHTVGLSRYTYPFKYGVLRDVEWYFPCLTPREIVTRVRQFVAQYKVVDCTDYSSFDGTNSRWLRENVERQCYLRYYPKEYHRELISYFDDELDCRAVTGFGVRYSPDGSRLSGSPLTTDGNTILNAFASYCGYRLLGVSPKQSFSQIGPKYGDDSIERSDCNLDDVCVAIGFSIKHHVVRAGSSLPFLGRIFVDPWVSDNTVQDPMRTLIKIHQSFPGGVTSDVQAAINRCSGYLVTDANTPLIGDYCRAVIRVFGGEYKFGADREMDFRVLNGAWPHEPGNEDLALRVVADSCGLSVADLSVCIAAVSSWSDVKHFQVLVNNQLRVEVVAQVDGKLVGPDATAVSVDNVRDVAHKRRRPKRR